MMIRYDYVTKRREDVKPMDENQQAWGNLLSCTRGSMSGCTGRAVGG